MRSELLQFLFYAMALVVGGAAEECLPHVFGVGVPVLLAMSAGVAVRRTVPAAIVFACAAGAFEDALSSLPTMTSPCVFLAVSMVVRRTGFARLSLAFAYPFYQIWLKLVVPDLAGSLNVRLLAAVFLALVMAFAALPFFAWVERKAALDEA